MNNSDLFVDTFQEWVAMFMRRSMRGFIRYSRESGLSLSQLGALFHIQRQGSSGVSGLGEHLGVTSAAASQLLDRLVHQGLILRTEDPNDRRSKQIILTDKGNKTLQESIRARQGWITDLANDLTPHEIDQIIPALKILIEKTRISKGNQKATS